MPDGHSTSPSLTFVVDELLIPSFFPLLQRGVTIRCRLGISITVFLREKIGATAGTINRIQSVILDGMPVDDIEQAFIKDGSTLALSAAMPGLVGATLRRGGTYSSFRSAITYHEKGSPSLQGEGQVRVKLFNLLMSELGPGMLRKGVIVGGEEMVGLVTIQPREFWKGCRRITINNVPFDAMKLRDLSREERIFLVVTGG